MKACILSPVDASGLSTDIRVLTTELEKVATVDARTFKSALNNKDYDVKFILEHLEPWIFHMKGHTVWVPNIEIMTEWDLQLMPKADCIMCKTHDAYEYFKDKHHNAIYTSFTSLCRGADVRKNYNIWLHLGGTSFMKGTLELLTYWVANKGFLHINPSLKLVMTLSSTQWIPDRLAGINFWNSLARTSTKLFGRFTAEQHLNIYRVERLSDEDYAYCTGIAGVFIQPSVNEGYGHSLNEARCNKALLVTTNAPPMNGFVIDKRFLIDCDRVTPMTTLNTYKYAAKDDSIKAYHIGAAGFKRTVSRVLRMRANDRSAVIRRLHRNFVDDTEVFKQSVAGILAGVEEKKGGVKKHNSRYAYVTVLFKGDKYLPGVLALAHSLRKHSNVNDVCCMVTSDVPQTAIDAMRLVGVIVYKIPYLRYKTKPMKTQKQCVRYAAWIDASFTKFNCLSLTQYEKVLFLDADMIAQTVVDDVFEFPAPAGVFESPWDRQNYYRSDLSRVVTPAQIEKALSTRGFVATGTCMLLRPDKNDLKEFKKMVRSMQPFGFNSISGADEQSAAYYYSVYEKGPKTTWYNMGYSYAYMMWKYKVLKKTVDAPIKIIDYFGRDKPWTLAEGTWDDLKHWYDVWHDLKNTYPDLKVELVTTAAT